MNWLIDGALVAVIILIVVVNTKRGCITLFNLLTPIVSFIGSYFLGPVLGGKVVGSGILLKIKEMIQTLLEEAFYDSVEINITNVIENLPTSLKLLVERVGVSTEELINAISSSDTVELEVLAEKLAQPVSECLAISVGYVIAFVGVWIIMVIAKLLIELFVKLPVLKQANYLIGFVLGCVNAFAFTWIICLVTGILLDYSLLGEYNDVLASAVQNSLICRFFCNLSVADFSYMITAQ